MTTETNSGLYALLQANSTTDAQAAEVAAQWDARRVTVVNLHNKALTGRDGVAERLGECLRPFGYTLDDGAVMFCYDRRTLEFAWPRNVSWKALPIIGDPVYRVSHCAREMLGEARPLRQRNFMPDTSPKNGALFGARTELLVIATEELSSRDLYDMEMMRRQDRPELNSLMLHFDGRILREIAHEEVLQAWEQYYPHERFVYNHALNLLVIGARAYVPIARDRGDDQKDVETWMPQLHSYHWRFGYPLCVQILCSIGRWQHGEPTTWFRDVPQKEQWLWANRSNLFEKTEVGDQFVWPGSGRYQAWTDTITPHVAEGETRMEGTEFTRSYVYEIVSWMNSLNFAGFVCLDQNGDLCLTTKGRQYLDIVAPALDDPDVLLRWRTEDGLFCSMKDVPAVDRWMNRAFRKLKRAVSSLPASPINEEGVDPWPEYRTNVFLVRGWKVDVTDEMLLDEVFASQIQRIEEQQAAHTGADWREGVVRNGMGFGVQGRVKHVWFGRPLAICADQHKDIGRYELLADWSEIDADIASVAAPEWLGVQDATIGTLAFDEFARDPEVFVMPERIMIEDEHTFPVIHGRVLSLDLPLTDEEIARVLKHQQMGIAIMGRPIDGLRIFGQGSGARYRTISIGIQVGAFDPRTRKAFVDTSVCERRAWNVQRIFGRNKAGDAWECVLKHRDLSEEGCWIMLPDGRTIAVPIPSKA
ncbi:hypothetical protein G6L37_01995 [Agrobacterium rubi]|nr:hypothetical protein [Agrobacterium rubi]NTF24165.1 hypothetical protein [Agrobacterium rubi]